MGFYHPSTLIKDAQRHGLGFRPIDVTHSNWECTIETGAPGEKRSARGSFGEPSWQASGRASAEVRVRLGLMYAKGVRELAGRDIVRERARAPFASIDDLRRRVAELRRDELERLAELGALNFIDPAAGTHRRDALWQVELRRSIGPLYEEVKAADAPSPLAPMTDEERLSADFRGSGLTLGRHPMSFRRAELERLEAVRAVDLRKIHDGRPVRVGGCVIVRQRPGTAKGFVFLSLEDETGIANIIVTPDLFNRCRAELVNEPFLVIDGVVQNLEGVVSVKAERVQALPRARVAPASHDFQ